MILSKDCDENQGHHRAEIKSERRWTMSENYGQLVPSATARFMCPDHYLHAAPFHHLCRWLEGGSGRQQRRIDTLPVFSEAHLQEELHRSARTLQDSETASLNSFYTSCRALFVPIEYHHFRFQKTQEALGSWDSGTLGPTLSAIHSIWGANARSCALAMVRAILAKELTIMDVRSPRYSLKRKSRTAHQLFHMSTGTC